MVTGLCGMLSPILVFTADEAWEFIPGHKGDSVHLAVWKAAGLELSTEEQNRWKGLFELRELVLPLLEKERQAKNIGKALDAKVSLHGIAKLLPDWADTDGDTLRELLNVSQLAAERGAPDGELTIHVAKADGQKCERCWHWETDVGASREHPTLCGRCIQAIRSNAL
jgi:isoleucyl-tRNA synthetase